ncbi:hypothetical protein IQ270_08110 [Microcoleus sp. LEGE 07076]|uniref:hypothetical protein n=1 Tax=Microcoleus sp. LEGE 07076 TaxID=915322 RepID=UPI001880043A|nr:hypothetical protein [Microcoleus sp. LEGE 07076]MBE9184683.1 hypothetical protein [Microcoleus sp. LEGE 07076]
MSLLPPSKEKLAIENIVAPQTAPEYVGFIVLTVAISLVTAAAGSSLPGTILGAAVIAIFGFIWWRVDRARAKARVQRLYSDLAISVDKEAPTGAKGLILLLSPYSPRKAELKNESTIAPLMEAVINGEIDKLTQADFDRLDLLNSNLFPQIKAVEFHAKQEKLRDIWLISTERYETKEGKKVKGSEDSALILSQYLRFLYGKRLDINSEGLSVRDYDYQGLWRLAEQIFRDSGYKDEVIVADITGGTKMMSVALGMACIPPKRRMQYMDSQRDWEGNPVSAGDMQPVVIDVDPILYV